MKQGRNQCSSFLETSSPCLFHFDFTQKAIPPHTHPAVDVASRLGGRWTTAIYLACCANSFLTLSHPPFTLLPLCFLPPSSLLPPSVLTASSLLPHCFLPPSSLLPPSFLTAPSLLPPSSHLPDCSGGAASVAAMLEELVAVMKAAHVRVDCAHDLPRPSPEWQVDFQARDGPGTLMAGCLAEDSRFR